MLKELKTCTELYFGGSIFLGSFLWRRKRAFGSLQSEIWETILREKLTGILSLDSLKQAREPRSFSLEACFSQIADSAEYLKNISILWIHFLFNLHIYVYWISYQCIVLKFVVIVALNANKCVKRENITSMIFTNDYQHFVMLSGGFYVTSTTFEWILSLW